MLGKFRRGDLFPNSCLLVGQDVDGWLDLDVLVTIKFALGRKL